VNFLVFFHFPLENTSRVVSPAAGHTANFSRISPGKNKGDSEMSGTMQDRRDANRVPLILAVEVVEADSGTRLTGRTSDVSRTGCYIDTLNPTPTGTVVRVKFNHNGQELDLLARIVYVSPRLGMGVRFDESISPDQLAILDRWLS
jgi:hypothetical protein